MNGAGVALGFAIAGVVLSITALIWNMTDTLVVDRARLRPEVQSPIRIFGPMGQVGGICLCIAVTNVGKRRTRLTYLSLGIGRPPKLYRPPWLYRAKAKLGMRGKPISLMNPDAHPSNTTMPCVLDVGDDAILFYDLDAVEQYLDDTKRKHVFVHYKATGISRRYGRAHSRKRFRSADRPPDPH